MMSFTDRFFSTSHFRKGVTKLGQIFQACGFDLNPPPLKITKYTVESSRWPDHYKPLKIAAASDFHVGSTHVPLSYLESVVEKINTLKADIILLPGDFLNSPYGGDGIYIEPKQIAAVLGKLKAPLGVYAALGNHDHYEDPAGMCDALEANGIDVLYNQSILVSRDGQIFNLVGIGDATTGNANCKMAFSRVNSEIPTIAMCHNPITTHEISEVVVTVAGHTHGHQYKLPFIKQPVLGCPDYDLARGKTVKNGSSVIVSSGIGTSLVPFRNVAPEIVELNISAPS